MPARKKSVINKASLHIIKKFELIEKYIRSWAQKLMLDDACDGLIFIDCMCNSGIYTDDAVKIVKSTAVRVSEALLEVARTYTDKTVYIYLNDKDAKRVDELEKHFPQNERNFQIVMSKLDAHELLKTIGSQLYQMGHLHYFLFYDPVRAITSAKRKTTKEKYEIPTLRISRLVPFRSNKTAYEARVEEIIVSLYGTRRGENPDRGFFLLFFGQ